MDGLSKAREELCSGAYLLPPMEFFERRSPSSSDAMRDLLGKIERIIPDTKALYTWLKALSKTGSCAFYGSSILDDKPPSDIDLLVFPGALPLPSQTPASVHATNICRDESGCTGLFVANSLLFVCPLESEVAGRVESGRAAVRSSHFFSGGIGDIITYAAFKSLKAGVCGFEPGEWEYISGLRLSIRRGWTDYSNMLSHPYSLTETNNQVRAQMQQLGEKELGILTAAAMRRIRVKEERRAELSDRFIKELRLKRIHGSFG